VQEIILVNEKDEPVGVMDKMEAHQKGLLHRAFSVFIFDSKGRMLLQRRAAGKYHGAGLWTNACCSHPFPGETTEAAAQRRLQEELGFVTSLKEVFAFTYKADVENDLVEHEYDHVFVGEHNGSIEANKDEVAAHSYKEMKALKLDLLQRPQDFTSWFKLAFPRIEQWWQERYG
jgi:isopentenyl-diphosphate delta-isomerase